MKIHSVLIPAFSALAGLALQGLPATAADSRPTLKDTYKDSFKIGVAINRQQVFATPGLRADNASGSQDQLNKDVALIKEQFNQISPENDLKWEMIQPYEGPTGYSFRAADAYVNFGLSNNMYIVGHTLVWHSQTPGWVFSPTNTPPPEGWNPDDGGGRRGGGGGFGGGRGRGGPGGPQASRDQVLQRMHDHIMTVVGRYKGKIKCWDVVNEAIDDGGTNILRNSQWKQTIGEDFIAKAFTYAHEADPDCLLRYNDYSLENSSKRHKLITMIKSLQDQHIPVGAIGTQTHVSVSSPSFAQEDQALTEIESLGLPIHVTEFDVNSAQGGQRNTGADVAANASTTTGGLVSQADQKLADAYTGLFNAFLKHKKSVQVITFWGVNDRVSWRASGRPLLFDGNDEPKAAFDAVIKAHADYKP